MIDPSQVKNLTSPLETWAREMPEAIAVEDGVGQVLTYAQLDRLSERMAARLAAEGVRPGDRVGICVPKSINSVISIFGILKSGAAYIPMDFQAPPERNRFIAENCRMQAICIDEPRLEAIDPESFDCPALVFPGAATEGVGAPWLDDSTAAESRSRPADARFPEPEQEDLAYILYTSGSTGVPKGVMHTHASALSFVLWAADTTQPTAADRFSSHAPFHFDLSILDLYVPMIAGARFVIVGEDLGKDPRRLAPYVAEKRISIWYSVPSILSLLAQHGNLDEHDYSALRLVLFAGEVFPVKHLRALKQLWPDKTYYNLYGPTETNVCTFYRIPDVIEVDRIAPYPIGGACSNVEALVVDEHDQPIERSQEGQLLIHASGPVMKGYWDLDEQTERAFHEDPSGRRWYRTGDLVTTDEAGDYTFVGRRDRMVKRRGYRIELGEIESALYRHSNVREAAAVAVGTDEGVTITTFLSTKDEKPISIIALKQFCADNLPLYMNPDRFQFVEQLPRTSTDKVDYQSLTTAK